MSIDIRDLRRLIDKHNLGDPIKIYVSAPITISEDVTNFCLSVPENVTIVVVGEETDLLNER